MMRGDGGVLLVEDDPLVREVLALELEGEGFAVQHAQGGDIALDVLDGERGSRVLLLVTDLDLGPNRPGGRALAFEARRRRPGLPVVFITGHREPNGEPAWLGPRERLLRKPFAPEDLHATVRDLMRIAG